MKPLPVEDLPYTVDAVDLVAEASGVRVTVLALSAGQEVPWHVHTHVTDSFFCLSGRIEVRHGKEGRTELAPGDSLEVPARTPHRVTGPGRFLIVQGVGEYDFIPVRGPGGEAG